MLSKEICTPAVNNLDSSYCSLSRERKFYVDDCFNFLVIVVVFNISPNRS